MPLLEVFVAKKETNKLYKENKRLKIAYIDT